VGIYDCTQRVTFFYISVTTWYRILICMVKLCRLRSKNSFPFQIRNSISQFEVFAPLQIIDLMTFYFCTASNKMSARSIPALVISLWDMSQAGRIDGMV